MSCQSCNCNNKFAPIGQTWTNASSLTSNSWYPYPELTAPSSKETYGTDYLYSQNTCNPSAAGPPATNGYTLGNRQLPKKEGYEHCSQMPGRYKNIPTTWDIQKPYTL